VKGGVLKLKSLSSARTTRSWSSVVWRLARSSPVVVCSGVTFSGSVRGWERVGSGWPSSAVSVVGGAGVLAVSSGACACLNPFSRIMELRASSMACESLSSEVRFSILCSSFFLNSMSCLVLSASVDNFCAPVLCCGCLPYELFEGGARLFGGEGVVFVVVLGGGRVGWWFLKSVF